MPGFLSPLFLFAMVAAAIPVALHLLRREPEPRVKFSAVALLRQAPVERSSTRRLRQIVLLMLRVSALILLALAFARPFFASPAAAVPRSATIVLLALTDPAAVHGTLDVIQFVQAEPEVDCGPGDDEMVNIAF